MSWQPEHDAFVRACLSEGMSTAAAAAALNGKFGTDYTRNAVIGRATRESMDRNRSHASPRALKLQPWQAEGKAKRTWYRHKQIAEGRAPAKPPAKPAVDLPALRCVEIDPMHLSLVDLEFGQCRWPYGEGPFTFCGHPAVFGSYCGPHFALSIRREERRAA